VGRDGVTWIKEGASKGSRREKVARKPTRIATPIKKKKKFMGSKSHRGQLNQKSSRSFRSMKGGPRGPDPAFGGVTKVR